MNIKKQIRTLYLYEVVSGFQIVDLVWVLFLIQRGFSLAEAGIAEGVFHAVSMCCEIPSGMLSDLAGRRRTLAAAGIVSALSSFLMIATDFFPVILLAMGMNAVSYNLVSGTREALTYDSLLEAGGVHLSGTVRRHRSDQRCHNRRRLSGGLSYLCGTGFVLRRNRMAAERGKTLL